LQKTDWAEKLFWQWFNDLSADDQFEFTSKLLLKFARDLKSVADEPKPPKGA